MGGVRFSVEPFIVFRSGQDVRLSSTPDEPA
jgi:hypothetical protein